METPITDMLSFVANNYKENEIMKVVFLGLVCARTTHHILIGNYHLLKSITDDQQLEI